MRSLDSPDNFRATDDLSTLMGFKVIAKVTDQASIDQLLDKYYTEEDKGFGELLP